eukprot:COSAG06_NODE_16954_length_971_cov_0.638761_2_plen_82_part_00
MAQVILHDAEVDRTTDGCGTVWDLTLAEVKALRVVRTIPNAGRDTQASHTTAEALATAGDVTGNRFRRSRSCLTAYHPGWS